MELKDLYRATSLLGAYERLPTNLLSGSTGNTQPISRIVGGTYAPATETLTLTSGTPDTEEIFRGFISEVDDQTTFAITVAPAATTTTFLNVEFTGELVPDLRVDDILSIELRGTVGGSNTNGYSPPAEQVIGRLTLIGPIFGTGENARSVLSITSNDSVTTTVGQQIRIHRVNVVARSTVTTSHDENGFQLHNVDASRYPNLEDTTGMVAGVDTTPIAWTAATTPWTLNRYYVVGQRVSYLGLEYINATAGESFTTNAPGTTGGASVWTAAATTDIDAKYLSSDIQTTTGNFFFRRSGDYYFSC